MDAPRTDRLAGGLMVAIGVGAALIGATFNFGTLTRMGPGFLPVALGVLLALVGIGIAVAPVAPAAPGALVEARNHAAGSPDWRGWLAVAAGPLLFIVLAHWGGLIPASFACVFVSALGDRTSTWRGAFFLAVGVTIFGAVLFGLVLRVPLPMLHWG